MSTQTNARLDLKTHVRGHCVSTVALSTEHEWGPEPSGGYWFETYIFPSDGEKITSWLEEWGVRYRTEDEARAGHGRVVSQVERGELPNV
jgi:hypothetical protein